MIILIITWWIIYIYLVKEWDFSFPFMPTWRMISQKNFHIACASGTHSILKQNFSNQNIISFNPWINHILLYVVDSTNRQCTHVTLIFPIMLSLRFCYFEIPNLVWFYDFNQVYQFLDSIHLNFMKNESSFNMFF